MNPTKKNAARPGRVKAASVTTSDVNHSTQKRLFVVEKDALSEIRIELTFFMGKLYCALRIFDDRHGTRVPSKKGLTIPAAMLPALIDGLAKTQADVALATSEAQSGTTQKRIVVVEKDAFSEIRTELTDCAGEVYCDLRIFDIHHGTRVPSKKGLTIPAAMLPALIDALAKAQADVALAISEAQSVAA